MKLDMGKIEREARANARRDALKHDNRFRTRRVESKKGKKEKYPHKMFDH